MLDLPAIQNITLSAHPRVQRLIALGILVPNYHLLPGVDIRLEGVERLPNHPVLFAMNHTDRYNYWPFQYKLWRRTGRYTATWVKGKYYEHPIMGTFMALTNNIPTISRGYILTRDYLTTMGETPRDDVYRALRQLIEERAVNPTSAPPADLDVVPRKIFQQRREVLGLEFNPAVEEYATFINRLFGAMAARFVALNKEALNKNLDVIIFPQGTRSRRLSQGHVGIAQIALKYRCAVVPVGCNGSDQVYRGSSPWGHKGRIVYRIGAPIPFSEVAHLHPGVEFEPLTPEIEHRFHERFQALTDLVMDRINGLLDPEYQYSVDQESDGVAGAARFV